MSCSIPSGHFARAAIFLLRPPSAVNRPSLAHTKSVQDLLSFNDLRTTQKLKPDGQSADRRSHRTDYHFKRSNIAGGIPCPVAHYEGYCGNTIVASREFERHSVTAEIASTFECIA
jgi:hypothetical protein